MGETAKIIGRFQFHPDRASEFSDDGTEIVEVEVDTIEEFIDYCTEFESALIDAVVFFNGQTISVKDFPTTA